MKKIPKVILLIETSRAFGRDFLTGITKYSRLHGPWSFYRDPRDLKSVIPHIENWDADGIIMRNNPIIDKLINLNIPLISVLHYSSTASLIPKVRTDSDQIAKQATQHLLDRGFKNFAYCGFRHLDWSGERCKYFQKHINESDHSVNIYKQPASKKYKSWKNEQYLMVDWLKQLPKPAAIMACNDDRGQHVLEACKIAGLKVPEDVAVIGVDNDKLICDLCDPPLSSIALDTIDAGYKTAALLDRLMNGEQMEGQIIDVTATHIINRHSTDVLAIEDENLVKALTFIRENAREKISVADVVEATTMSRRNLEKRFKKVLNRSIMEEVRRIRIGLISQLLIDTDLSIAEISASFNFSDIEHISRYFKREEGMSLKQFRKIHKNY